jgi:NAD(P)-dependent dehydrogenase (short-subunit alcohol dehydrogenase family)
MTLPLDKRVAIVTGGSRGIGYAIAEALAGDGASVAISGTRDEHLKEAESRLSARFPGRVLAARADVRDASQVASLVESTVERFGGLDILVNNAGVGHFVEVARMTSAQWQEVIDTNLSGVFHACHAALPHLGRRGGGWIINISSLAARNAFAGGAAYGASKAGLIAFSESLMQEVRYDDIRVSCIMPGSVDTSFMGRGQTGAAGWKLAPGDVAQVVLDLVHHDRRSLPSRVELRPSKPRKG